MKQELIDKLASMTGLRKAVVMGVTAPNVYRLANGQLIDLATLDGIAALWSDGWWWARSSNSDGRWVAGMKGSNQKPLSLPCKRFMVCCSTSFHLVANRPRISVLREARAACV